MRRVPPFKGPARPADELAPLAKKAGAGDPPAVKALLEQVLPSMLRVVQQVLGRNHVDAEDVLQESSFALVEALQTFRQECKVRHFACRIALLTALNARRRLRLRECFIPVSSVDLDETVANASPAATLFAERRRGAVLQLLDELPAAQAEVLAMHCILGYTLTETADATGVPVNTVRSRLQSAKSSLKSILEANRETEEQLRDWSEGTG